MAEGGRQGSCPRRPPSLVWMLERPRQRALKCSKKYYIQKQKK